MKQATATTTLVPDNTDNTAASLQGHDTFTQGDIWALLIADICDSLVRDPGTYVTWGLNRAKNSLLVTVTSSNGAKIYASGVTTDSLQQDMLAKVADERILTVLDLQ